jgi:hypothetical protein
MFMLDALGDNDGSDAQGLVTVSRDRCQQQLQLLAFMSTFDAIELWRSMGKHIPHQVQQCTASDSLCAC